MCLGTIGQITDLGPDRSVRVSAGGREIDGSLLAVSETLGLGDWVVVHSGLVLARLSENEALEALALREPTCDGAP